MQMYILKKIFCQNTYTFFFMIINYDMKELIKNSCLACGEKENIGKRKYCSLDCRQRLKNKLNVRTGLLKALNTKYATFSFTETEIILNLLVFDSEDIYSFILQRTPGKKPADDFSKLADRLGNAWWAERRRTEKHYLANRHVLNYAKTNKAASDLIRPKEILTPAVIGKSITCLKLNKRSFNSSEIAGIIKSAFRKMAKIHHPDQGGNADKFRKIHDAYTELLNWSENQRFFKRRGFHDKWFYDGYKNKWSQPIMI